MVRALNLLRNVGKFEDVTAGAQLPFGRVTVIYAENARGKTTLAALLRSLASGRAELVTERARLGSLQPPHIVIDTGSGAPAVFQNGAWSSTAPDILIFDDTFVSENVCSGIEVGTTQRQNLHELIVGSQGVTLARLLQAEVDRIEEHNSALRDKENLIPATPRGGMPIDAFCALSPVPEISRLIEEAERRLAAGRDADRVATMPPLPAISLPKIDAGALRTLLSKGLSDLEAGALALVQTHLARLGRGGENWVGAGMDFVEHLTQSDHHECPFCAQALNGSPLIAHYRAYFADAYEQLKKEIDDATRRFHTEHEGDIPSAFERRVREAVERQTFWKAFADVPDVVIDTEAIARTWKSARQRVVRLLELKRAAPLDAVSVSHEDDAAIAAHNEQCDQIFEVSVEFENINARLETVREQAREANVATLAADVTNLRAAEARYDTAIAPLCDSYLAEKAAKSNTAARRDAARVALDQHRQAAFPAYGIAINDFLQRFNASFRVGPVDPVNTRGGSVANYTLMIDAHPVPLTDTVGSPSFRNTLSAGDRNTLALAFFFASLDADPQRSQRVVVIDDPMTSLDEHRTLHTLQEMHRLAREVSSMVVLSHSKPFLLGVWDKCQQLPKAALEVRRAGAGSTLTAWDVSSAKLTEHDRRYALASKYLQQSDPTTERRVAESLRLMLETFCRIAYPASFPPGTMLGTFHNNCAQRAGTAQEIMSAAAATELRALLDYANRFHHDTNTAYATEVINDAELTDFTRRTLLFIRHT